MKEKLRVASARTLADRGKWIAHHGQEVVVESELPCVDVDQGPVMDPEFPCHNAESTMIPPYIYEPLDEEDGKIRIMCLFLANTRADQRILIKLQEWPLDRETLPEFEPLSYCWGPEEDTVDILVETESGEQSLPVRRNLADALLALRYDDNGRLLWIDAICIDQNNLPERGSQAKKMAEIYTGRKVVVWLGSEKEDSSLALDLLGSLSEKIDVGWDFLTMTAVSEDPPEQHWADWEQDLPYSEREKLAIAKILEREWFERL